jgi:hypothetical protein
MCFTIENVQQKIIYVHVGTLVSLKMPYNCVDTSTLFKKNWEIWKGSGRSHI